MRGIKQGDMVAESDLVWLEWSERVLWGYIEQIVKNQPSGNLEEGMF